MWILELTVCFSLLGQPAECHRLITVPVETRKECGEMGKQTLKDLEIFASNFEVTIKYQDVNCIEGKDA